MSLSMQKEKNSFFLFSSFAKTQTKKTIACLALVKNPKLPSAAPYI